MAGPLILGAGLVLVGYLLWDEFFYAASPEFRQGVNETISLAGRLGWRTYLPLPVAVFIAVLMLEGPIISVYLILLGIAATVYLARRSLREAAVRLDEEIATLVESFRNVFRIRPAVFSSLAEARKKVRRPLRTYVTAAVETFYVTSSQERAFSELRERSDNPYLNQFIYILERIQVARREAILDALQDLVDRLQRREELRRQTEIDLTVITAQTQIILIISVLIIIVVALIRPLRVAYTGSIVGQLIFIGGVSVAAYTAYRIDRRVMELKERVL